MAPGMFPHPTALTAFHMASTGSMLLGLYAWDPTFFPMMKKAGAQFQVALFYVLPSGLFFAMAMYFSNKALEYNSIAFVQFCKEGNVAVVFLLSCVAGLQAITWQKLLAVSVILTGCFLCTWGELEFSEIGFAFQMVAQFSDSSKNIVMEMLLGSTGLKLDVLTYLAFQAPCSLVWLLAWLKVQWTPAIIPAFTAHWHLLFANALVAFLVNFTAAIAIKKLSAMGFVFVGVAKDLVIFFASSAVFQSPISSQQLLAFPVIVLGLCIWAWVRSQEETEISAETQCLLQKTPLPVHSKNDLGRRCRQFGV